MADGGFINFTKEDLQTDSGVANLNTILNLLAINIAGDTENVRIYSGYGSPESVVTAGIGSIFMRVDGGTGTSVYRKESGTGNTGWVAVSDLALPVSVANGGTGSNFSSTAQGNIWYFSATGVVSALAPGTSGYYLQTQGNGANPQWAQVSQALTLISTTTWTSAVDSGDISITAGNQYLVVVQTDRVTDSSSINADFAVRFNNSSSAVYSHSNVGRNSSGTTLAGSGTAATSMKINNGYTVSLGASSPNWFSTFYLRTNPGSSASGQIWGQAAFDSTNAAFCTFQGRGDSLGGAITSFRFLETGAQTFDGTIQLYKVT